LYLQVHRRVTAEHLGPVWCLTVRGSAGHLPASGIHLHL